MRPENNNDEMPQVSSTHCYVSLAPSYVESFNPIAVDRLQKIHKLFSHF